MTAIVQKGDPALRAVAENVQLSEIGSPRVRKIIDDMQASLEREDDGVALAAPQIGVSLRIFVVSPRVFAHNNESEDAPRGSAQPLDSDQPLLYINPTIIKTSRRRRTLDEGCLSVRWLYGKVSRAERTTVSAYDALGKPFTRGASGLLAQIFQHEIDHLDGVLFIDKAKDIQEIPPERVNQMQASSKKPKAASSKKAHR